MATSNQPNIVLTGLDGTGKNAVGRRISTLTGRGFVDINAELAASHGSLVAHTDEESAEQLAAAERELIVKLAPQRNLVIATGETTMLDQENVVALLGAEVFTLTSDVNEIEKQLEGTDNVRSAEELQQLLDSRAEQYGRFTTVDTSGKTAEDVIAALREVGASIAEAGDGLAEAQNQDNVNRIFMVVIAVALAVLIVVLFLVLTF